MSSRTRCCSSGSRWRVASKARVTSLLGPRSSGSKGRLSVVMLSEVAMLRRAPRLGVEVPAS